MPRLLALFCLFVATTTLAAPLQVKLVYQATRNGQPFATITETFQQENERYRIESVTDGIGVYALFGKRRLLSEGEVTAQGLHPKHFEQQQGDNAKKAVSADFDWEAKTIAMNAKGKTTSVPLEDGTQDLLSYAYQFMFRHPQGAELRLAVTTGKKLRNYLYRVAEKDDRQEALSGVCKTVHLANGAKDGEEDKELWLGVEQYYLPVRISMKDENGARIEQVLTSLHVD